MPRAQNSQGFINAAILLELEDSKSKGKVINSRLCFGGVAANYCRATEIEEILKGQCYYSRDIISKIFNKFPSTLEPETKNADASPEYRIILTCSLLYKMFLKIAPVEIVRPSYRSGGEVLKRELSSGTQKFVTNRKNYPMNEPVEKLEGKALHYL